MAGVAQPRQNPVGNNETGGTSKTPAQAITDLTAQVTRLMITVVTAENQEAINAELAKLWEVMAKAQRDVEAEAARMAMQQARICAQTERLNTEGWRLERQQRSSDAIHQRRHHKRLPADLHPTRLFDTPRTPGEGPDQPLQAAPGGGPIRPPNRPPRQPTEAHATRF
ncbi:hypothetical protein ZWY2020_034520 [Hordeum vulgare]|nr:hypothetical protein ZWY2020_034520 [Hordeum vulgare]